MAVATTHREEQTGVDHRALDWLEHHAATRLGPYAGRWVAIGPDGVIAVGDDDYRTWQRAKAHGVPRPLVIRVQQGTWRWK